jgi:murein DD-endopeptidase MepM/ murein hydrolase activator NlpD
MRLGRVAGFGRFAPAGGGQTDAEIGREIVSDPDSETGAAAAGKGGLQDTATVHTEAASGRWARFAPLRTEAASSRWARFAPSHPRRHPCCPGRYRLRHLAPSPSVGSVDHRSQRSFAPLSAQCLPNNYLTPRPANGLVAPFALRVGQALRIPASGTESAAVQSKTTKPAISARRPAAPAAVPRPPPARGGFVWPLQGKVISSFGAKSKGLHNDGINIAARRGTSVRAAENGVVAYAGNELRGFGNMLLIKHAGGWITAYAHNEKLLVKRGDKVSRGQIIARVGSSGSVTKPQLHFELRKGKQAVDPRKYLRRGSA